VPSSRVPINPTNTRCSSPIATDHPLKSPPALSRRTSELSSALARLEQSTGTAAETIEHGGVELGDALRRELSQMNQVLDEYTRLFEHNLGALQ